MIANALVGDRERCLQAGMDDDLAEPLGLPEVKGKLLRTNKMALRDSRPQTVGQDVPPGDPIYDALMSLGSDLGPEALLLLTNEFLEDCPERFKRFHDLLDAQDFATTLNEVHSFKSLCLTYGMVKTGHIAQEIESATKSRPLQVEPKQLALMEEAYTLEAPQVRRHRDHIIECLQRSVGE